MQIECAAYVIVVNGGGFYGCGPAEGASCWQADALMKALNGQLQLLLCIVVHDIDGPNMSTPLCAPVFFPLRKVGEYCVGLTIRREI